MKRFSASICLLLGTSCLLQAQYVPNPTATSHSNRGLQVLVEQVSPFGWIQFRQEAQLPMDSFFEEYASLMGLQTEDEMRLTKRHMSTSSDDRHLHFQQYHEGILVEGGEYSLHGGPEGLRMAHGKIVESLAGNNRFVVEEKRALRAALLSLGSNTRYAWQDSSWEQALREENGDPALTYYPSGEKRLSLIQGDQMTAENYRPCWYFEVRSLSPDGLYGIYVDGQSGEVLNIRSLRRQCQDVTGTAHTLYNSYQSFAIHDRGFPNGDHILKNCRNIHTKFHSLNSFGETRSWRWTSNITHTDNDWDNTHQQATSAHWAAEQAWDYFATAHQHQMEEPVRILSDWKSAGGSPLGDAMYEKQGKHHYLYIGEIENNSLATLDILGHEFAHAVHSGTAALVYERESGALDESFADIFGVLIEAFAQGEGSPSDWTIGEDAWTMRSLADPASFDQPSVYQTDPLWFDASEINCEVPVGQQSPFGNDFCGVHQNSGVQNHWFYLLAQGGEQLGQEVYGIGLKKAAQIVYRNVSVYLQSYSNYQDARQGSIAAAEDLFGECSNEVAQVQNAWAAVGLGEANTSICLELQGPTQVCLNSPDPNPTFEAIGVAGTQFSWENIPGHWQYRLSGPGESTLTLNQFINPPDSLEITVVATLAGVSTVQYHTIFFPEQCAEENDDDDDPGKQELGVEWRLSPNPVLEQMYVNLPEGAFPAELTVVDMLGRQVYRTEARTQNVSLTLSQLAEGYYVLLLHHPLGIRSKRFQVLR